MNHYDALIIGSGQGGTPLSKKLANADYRTALIERRLIGGTCVNDGCTPTKAMIGSAEVAYLSRHADELGVNVKNFETDIEKVISRQQNIVKSSREGAEKGLAKTKGLDLIYGEASFSGHKKINVRTSSGTNETMKADLIFIDTGTSPAIPNIEGRDAIPWLTSTSILELRELPDHLLIIGGGNVAVEFAQMYRRFGSTVTMLVRSGQLLKKEDKDIAEEVRKILEDEGVLIRLNSEATRFEKSDQSTTVTIKQSNKTSRLECSHVLFATGRKPNTEELNLAASGINTNEKGFIEVNEKLETSIEGIYAMGDVNGGPAFTHISYHDHLIVYNNIVHQHKETTTGRMVPYCIFIDPQLGRIGMTEDEARANHRDIKVAKLPMTKVARAIQTGDTRGLMKAVVDAKTGKILGASILGAEGGEIMSLLEVAMMGNLRYDALRDGIFAHPTYAESLNNLFATLD